MHRIRFQAQEFTKSSMVKICSRWESAAD